MTILGGMNMSDKQVAKYFAAKPAAMQITVSIRNVYGNELIYPVCDNAKTFCDIAGTKTLSRSAIENIRLLGYRVELEQRTL